MVDYLVHLLVHAVHEDLEALVAQLDPFVLHNLVILASQILQIGHENLLVHEDLNNQVDHEIRELLCILADLWALQTAQVETYCIRVLNILSLLAVIYIIIESCVILCYLSPPKPLDGRWRTFACRRVSSMGRTFAECYVDRGHRWEENEHRKTVLTLLLLLLNGRC